MTDEAASGASLASSEEKDSASAASSAPLLRVITPTATPEEIAAIVAVFSAMGGSAAEPEKPRSEWASPARRMRAPLFHHRGAWQASARGGR